MSNLSSDLFRTNLSMIRRQARRGAQAQHIRLMLMAATISAFGVVAVAATMLTQLI